MFLLYNTLLAFSSVHFIFIFGLCRLRRHGANLYVTLNINCFVFGGGLLKMNVRLLERVRKAFDEYNRNDMPVYFKTAELGEHFGIVGAAELLY